MSQIPVQNFTWSPDSPPPVFRLLELSSELCKLIDENAPGFKLEIKGKNADDAVVCTSNKTYAIRAVNVSNSLHVGTGSNVDNESLVLHEEIHEIMELVPAVPKLERLNGLLRGLQYDDDDEDEIENDGERIKSKYTIADLTTLVQASDAELTQALRTNYVLQLDDGLRPLSLDHLRTILIIILTSIISHGLPRQGILADRLLEILEQEHQAPREITGQVLEWFGSINDGIWVMDEKKIVTAVGLATLKPHQNDPIEINNFLDQWRTEVGDAFASLVDLSLLRGEYLVQKNSHALVTSTTISYFSKSVLPSEPLQRFNDLFLSRSKWNAEDIIPFIEDIAVDSKDCDRLLMKYARRSTDRDGKVVYTARTSHI